MIDLFGQVMLYVKNPKEVAAFWVEKIGFVTRRACSNEGGLLSCEVAPTPHADTSFVLFERERIAQLEPELPMGTPSILFSSYNLDETYAAFKAKGVTVGDIVQMRDMRTFNFADPEGNYFAIREIQNAP